MKKILSFFLCVIVGLSTFCSFKVFSLSGNTVLKSLNKQPAVGDIITVEITYKTENTVFAAEGDIEFSSEKLEYISSSSENSNLFENGKIKIVKSGNSDVFTFNISFKVKSYGDTEIILKNCVVSDAETEYEISGSNLKLEFQKKENKNIPSKPVVSYCTYNSIVLLSQNGCEYSIDGINWQSDVYFGNLNSASEYTLYQRYYETADTTCSAKSEALVVYTASEVSKLTGDVNGDGFVNATDLALLKKIIAGLQISGSSTELYPDVDKNGSVPNAADLALLKKIIAGLS